MCRRVNHTIVLKEGERKFALPDSMIVDNKYTFQYFPSDFRLWDPKIAHKADKKQYLHQGKSYYLPFETYPLPEQSMELVPKVIHYACPRFG